MEYNSYTADDFIKDECFQQWVLSTDNATNEFWNTWLSENPDKIAEINEARNFILALKFKEDKPTKAKEESVWRNIENEIIGSVQSGIISINWYMKIAAVLAIATLIGVGLLYLSPIAGSVDKLSMQMIESGKKERKVVHLPDGSVVWLNAESKLYYPSQFDTDKRTVYLEGEAFFDVVKNKNAPFTVKASELNIRVLGTSFNVCSYDDDDEIETTLVTGAVGIENVSAIPIKQQPNIIALEPNEKATFSKNSTSIEKALVDTKYYTSWKEGKLLFNNEKLETVVKRLSKWYGVNINIEDEAVKQCRITLKIDNEPLKQVLNILKMTTPVQYTYHDNGDVIVKGSSCM